VNGPVGVPPGQEPVVAGPSNEIAPPLPPLPGFAFWPVALLSLNVEFAIVRSMFPRLPSAPPLLQLVPTYDLIPWGASTAFPPSRPSTARPKRTPPSAGLPPP
jgi:hypothetical protein